MVNGSDQPGQDASAQDASTEDASAQDQFPPDEPTQVAQPTQSTDSGQTSAWASAGEVAQQPDPARRVDEGTESAEHERPRPAGEDKVAG